jgi:16S rRNA (guanine(1405)-N(7))-methyltransferase
MPPWWTEPAWSPLVDEVVAGVVARYRVDEDAARRAVADALAEAANLSAQIATKGTTPERIKRTRAFKEAVSGIRRRVYHSLRRYQDEDQQDALVAELMQLGVSAPSAIGRDERLAAVLDQIVAGHASTRERSPTEAAFYDALCNAIRDATSILDVGCGVQPLRFPFARFPALRTYLALDENRRSAMAVAALAAATGNDTLHARCDNLADGWNGALAAAGVEDQFEAALLLKLVPVVARQQRELLDVLAQTPARRWIVSGSTTALAKRESIERRERAVVRKFLVAAGRTIRDEHVIGDEFVYIVE